MGDPLLFDRLARRVLKTDDDGVTRIDVRGLAREVRRYDAEIQERLRRAALRAIEKELTAIRRERSRPDDEE